jgi:hypothetical protein
VSVAQVRERLRSNLGRVQSLVDLYDRVESKGGPTKTDTLRAAVVFLHATLEDVVRTMLELRLPSASPEQLSMLRFAAGKKRKEQISMSELAQHRGKLVDHLIGEQIDAYLAKSNFNNVPDLLDALERSTLEKSLMTPYKKDLAAMMSRRHRIVHRADHNQDAGAPGQTRTLRIAVKTVATWKNTVETFCSAVLDKLEAP